jgi:aminopeptidase
MYRRYAKLLAHYCLGVEKHENVLIRSSYLAEPLLRELYREILSRGASYDAQIVIEDEDRIQIESAGDRVSAMTPMIRTAYEKYDAICTIRAPFNMKSINSVDLKLKKAAQESRREQQDIFRRRSAEGSLKWTLCEFPTHAAAQECGMSRSEYESFVFSACRLDRDDPVAAWKELSVSQEEVVRTLDRASRIRFVSNGTDITFSTAGRKWINSDGRWNMPSGEAFTSPVEDSGNGVVSFSFPGIHLGEEIEGVRLEVKDGLVTKWSAHKGMKLLDSIFEIDGARRFGEIAIGMNDGINRFTKNILFDEKMGGTVHMAIGASYPETGGQNESAVHWDLITDMRQDGRIYADDRCVYENGSFIR